MKAFVVLAVAAVGVAVAAPTEEIATTIHRSKKSAYGGAPCASSAPQIPLALYLSPGPQAPHVLGPALTHYREDEHKDDHMKNTETEQARYYDSPAVAAIAAASAHAPAAIAAASAPAAIPVALPSSAAVGLFPNAKVGGCAIPLLLSCAPNVVSGHMAHAASAPGPYAYRTVDHEMRESPDKAWSDAALAMDHHHTVHFANDGHNHEALNIHL